MIDLTPTRDDCDRAVRFKLVCLNVRAVGTAYAALRLLLQFGAQRSKQGRAVFRQPDAQHHEKINLTICYITY